MGISIRWLQFLCLLVCLVNGYLSRRMFGYSEKCKADASEPWSYRGGNGPHHWGDRYPQCSGFEQSPIAIKSHHVITDGRLTKLGMSNYDRPVTRATIENNGHSIQITPTDGVDRILYVNDESYALTQFHFHWGDSRKGGSEHTVDGDRYSMELHFVHENANNQISVLGVFLQEKRTNNPELQKIIDRFPQVMYKDMTTELKSSLKLINLLPSNPASFYRYQGSLTTPDCAQGVIWSIMTDPIPVGYKQIEEFRKLYSAPKSEATKNCKISNNYRLIQPLNHRKVFTSQKFIH